MKKLGLAQRIYVVVLILALSGGILYAVFSPVSAAYWNARKPPAAKTLEELAEINYFGGMNFNSSNDIYIIDVRELPADKYIMITSLQGIVAQEAACIYIVGGDNEREYLKIYEQNGANLIYRDGYNNNWTAWTLVRRFLPYIKDKGYIKYTKDNDNPGINMAATIAGVESWLCVSAALEEEAKSEGIVKKYDLTEGTQDRVEMQKQVFEKYKDRLNGHVIIHQMEDNIKLRDFGVQNKAFVFYTRENRKEKAFRKTVMEWAEANAPVLGWTENEVAFVAHISKSGHYVIPMDHASNSSYYIGNKLGAAKQKYERRIADVRNPDPTKHYIAIVVSDGDNIQYVQGGFGAFYDAKKANVDFPVSWTYPPLLNEMGIIVNSRHYGNATADDYFIAGVSGTGYMNPSKYPYDFMDGFTTMTAAGMLRSDMSIVTILDTKKQSDKAFISKLDYYSRFQNIKGGVLEIDPTMYEGNKGKVFFSNGKPFVSVKMSLWHPSGKSGQADSAWLKSKADMVNFYAKDVKSIDGYSVINIHPWSVGMANVAEFVTYLDANVVLVSAEELIEMIYWNIPHKTATPKNS